ncbi:MAG: hypothetical protein EOO74_01715 [Myxococcales bacterium]|nr:MAG: hypothetical protein EOO74_01715 [Myxococcales bacterium]
MLVTQSGCYDWVAIQPTEVSKLRPGSVDLVDSSSSQGRTTSTYAVSKQYVTRVDGTSYELSGVYDLRLDTGTGKPITAKHPVVVTSGTDFYQVQGSNLPSTSIRPETITKAEVSQYNNVKSAVAIGIPSILGGILLGYALTR